jgi:hypothetical protein
VSSCASASVFASKSILESASPGVESSFGASSVDSVSVAAGSSDFSSSVEAAFSDFFFFVSFTSGIISSTTVSSILTYTVLSFKNWDLLSSN